jgi:protein-S-isoprenylcysteine O-methyltransferase Ste14
MTPSAPETSGVRFPPPLIVVGVLTFLRTGTSPNTTRPSRALALAGPDRFTRNPMYLGWAIACAGVAVAGNALWPLALLPVAILLMNRCVIAREERSMESRFGSDDRRYKKSARRWL